MTSNEPEFDPDDNFASSGQDGMDVDDDTTFQALVWQLLLLINPGDDEAALQQFAAWQEALADAGGTEVEGIVVDGIDIDGIQALELLKDVIDWKSGFHIEAADPAALIESLDELASRWNLQIDWGVEDPGDEAFLRDADVPTLIALAHGKLREYGYSLWTWNLRGGASEVVYTGWIALRRDDEAMQAIAHALDIELRPGSAY